MLVKTYDGDNGTKAPAERRYSPAVCTGDPDPDFISTSHVERQNLTMRMHMRRFTRLKWARETREAKKRDPKSN